MSQGAPEKISTFVAPACVVRLPTWRDAGRDGGGGQLALAFGGHPCHFNSVGGESSESGDPVLQGETWQVMGNSGIRPVILLP